MTTLHIHKYPDDAPARHIRVPGWAVLLASRALPHPARTALAREGIDLEAIAAALRDNAPYRSALEVKEHGIRTTVLVQLGA